MGFSFNSELLARWLISGSTNPESRNAKAYGCYIENTHLCMAFSVQLNGWTSSAVASEWQWGGAVTRRACVTLECIHSLLLLSHRGNGQGFLLTWQLVKLLCSIRYGFSLQFLCSFLSLITKIVYSWVHYTRLVSVSWSVLQAKEIFGSKSNKSYEWILVIWCQWRAGHNRAISHSDTACLNYVGDIFLLYFECVPEPQKELSFFLDSKHIEKWTQTWQTFMSSFVWKCREFLGLISNMLGWKLKEILCFT